MKTYYKVVTPLNHSAIEYHKVVKYRLGEAVKPLDKHSKLYIFKTLKAAKLFFAFTSSKFLIYQCTATNVTEPVNFIMTSEVWKLYRKAKKQKKNATKMLKHAGSLYTTLPKHTLWADSVTLTKLIQ